MNFQPPIPVTAQRLYGIENYKGITGRSWSLTVPLTLERLSYLPKLSLHLASFHHLSPPLTTSPPFNMTSISNTTDPLLARSFSTDEEIPEVRSIVKIRLPKAISGPGSLLSGSAVSGATQGTYHSAIVRYSIPDYARRCIVVSVWPVPAYSAAVAWYSSGAAWMRDQPEDFRDANIPFPSDEDTREPPHPPCGFGEPITISQYRDRRPSWILMESQTLDLAFTKAVGPSIFTLVSTINKC